MPTTVPSLMVVLSIAFAVSVMVFGWATLYWKAIQRRQLSLASLFVLTLFVAIGVGVPLLLLGLPTVETR